MAKQVLIVDDAVELGRMLRAAVESLEPGLEARLFRSAEEAQLEMMHRPYDLLIADIRLPGMSGLDLTRRLRESGNDLKIFLITGLTAKDLSEKSREAGADRFLPKPFLMSEFMAITADLLGLDPVPAKPVAAAQPHKPRLATGDIKKILQTLQNRLGSTRVVLINDRGGVTALVGEALPPDFDKQWSPPILAALEGILQASKLVNQGEPQGTVVLPGDHQQLILTPIGKYALAIVLGEDNRGLRAALALEEVLDTRDQLYPLLMGAPAEKQPSGPAPVVVETGPAGPLSIPLPTFAPKIEPQKENPPEISAIPGKKVEQDEPAAAPAEIQPDIKSEPVLPELVESPFVMPPAEPEIKPVGPFTLYDEDELDGIATILDETRPPVDQQSADDYWEQGLTEHSNPVESSEGLTYEEASRLGLIPDQD